MSGAVGRMQRRSFGIALRKQIGAITAEDLMEGRRIQDVAMNRVVQSWMGQQIVDSTGESLRPKAAMHKPLLVPHRLESAACNLGYQHTHVWGAERIEA